MSKLDEMISKSLNELDELAKSMPDEEPAPEEVAEDAPTGEEPTGEEPMGEEGAPQESMEGNDEGGEAPEPEEEQPEVDEDEPVEKSLVDTLNEDQDVQKALEVSEFLKSFVEGISEVISNQGTSLHKSLADNKMATEDMLVKSLQALAQGQQTVLKSVNAKLSQLERKVSELEAEPTVRKSIATTPQTTVVERPFVGDNLQKSIPAQNDTLSKSEACCRLMDAYQGGNADLMSDILALESTGNFSTLSDGAKRVLNIN